MVIGSITLTGGNSGDFTIREDKCSGATLRNFENCTVKIAFRPSTEGMKQATLSIPSNDPDTPLLNITLAGWAVTAPPILLQQPSEGDFFGACSAFSLPTFTWNTAGVFKSYQIQFSSDDQFGLIPVKVRVNGKKVQATLPLNTWKKVLLLPGGYGGTVYWRVIGTGSNKSTAVSNVGSLVIESPYAIENPSLSPIDGTSRPTLSWNNNCNTKFKVWFGNKADFTEPGMKKKVFSFTDSDPAGSGGMFTKTLATSQWASIKKLIKNQDNSTIYWYVESRDRFNRYGKTEVMYFVVTD